MVRVRPLVLATQLALRLQAAVRNAPPQSNTVTVSRRHFVLVWLGLLSFHAICAAFYAVWAYVHMLTSFSSDATSLSYVGLIQSATAFSVAGWIFALCASVHIVAIADVLLASWKRRNLVLINMHPSRWSKWWTRNPLTRWIWDPYVAFKRRFPDEIFVFQESLQIVLLSTRAYGYTRWQSRSWLLRAYVVLVVLNCWSSPLIQWLQRRAKTRRRMLCYVFDMVSDLASTLVLPAAMAWPQLPLFDPSFVWYRGSDATDELSRYQRRIFQGVAQSWFDIFNFVVFSVFLYTRVVSIRGSIRCRDDRVSAMTVTSVLSMPSMPCQVPHKKAHRSKDTLIRVVHGLGIVWGFIILVAHCVSETRPMYAWCVGQTSPWFTTAARCETVKFDCTASQNLGRGLKMKHAFATLLRSDVRVCSIVNCPALEMPSAIQTLINLEKLYIDNSTITQWDSSAAILERYQPQLNAISITNARFPNGLPEGLCCTGDLPAYVSSLTVTNSNLSTLPERLDAVWHSPYWLILDGNAFVTVPPVVTRLPFLLLSMASNNLTSVPAKVLAYRDRFAEVDLSNNPILALPDPLPTYPAQGQLLAYLKLKNTEIAQLPSWIWRSQGVSLLGTPFCAAYNSVRADQRVQWLEDHGHDTTVAPLVQNVIVCANPK